MFESQSLPLRECGLKSVKVNAIIILLKVTPLAGVWIEIFVLKAEGDMSESLPLRECGLKSGVDRLDCCVCGWSLPLRECGLKYIVL